MTTISEFLDMGGYGAFIWSAYSITAAVLLFLVIFSVRRLRQIENDLKPLEEGRKNRRRRKSEKESVPS